MCGVLSFLWWFAAGAEFASLLPEAALGSPRLCHRDYLHRPVHGARASLALAHGICRDARPSSGQGLETRSPRPFLFCGIAPRFSPDSVAFAGWELRLHSPGKLAGAGVCHCPVHFLGMVRWVGAALRNNSPGQTAALFPLDVDVLFCCGFGLRWHAASRGEAVPLSARG